MKKNKLLFKFIVLFSLSLLWQCNEKTYVPTQPDETFAELSGTILDLKTLFPVDSARITTIPETQVVYTDSVGKFLFKKIKTGDYIFIFSKVGYLTDSLTTRLKENEKKEILLKLSHDPAFTNLSNDIFVITYKGNVYGYDWETLSLNSELNIGPDPRNIIFSDDGKIIIVSSHSSNTISIIEANTNSLIKTIAIDGRPNGIAFISQLNRIYVSNATKNQIEVIDLNNYQIIKRIELVDSPYPLVASHSGEIIYTSTILGYFIAISTQDDQIKNSLKFEKEKLYNLFISPDDKFAYISSFSGNTIYVVNLNSFSLVKTITEITKFSFPNGSIDGLAVSPKNDFLYFCDRGPDYVGVIDIQQNKIIKRIEVENRPMDLNISSNGRYLFSLQFGAIPIDFPTFKPIPGSIIVIDTKNMSIVKTVTLPKAEAAAITINPTLNF